MKTVDKQQGRLRWIIIIIVGLVLASYYFNFSVKDAVENEQTQENYNYIKDQGADFYNKHLSSGVNYFWHEIFIKLIWSSFTENMERIKSGEPTVFETSAPYVVDWEKANFENSSNQQEIEKSGELENIQINNEHEVDKSI